MGHNVGKRGEFVLFLYDVGAIKLVIYWTRCASDANVSGITINVYIRTFRFPNVRHIKVQVSP